jgi:hypothetical protein
MRIWILLLVLGVFYSSFGLAQTLETPSGLKLKIENGQLVLEKDPGDGSLPSISSFTSEDVEFIKALKSLIRPGDGPGDDGAGVAGGGGGFGGGSPIVVGPGGGIFIETNPDEPTEGLAELLTQEQLETLGRQLNDSTIIEIENSELLLRVQRP